ncbi:uncharacterized protein [Miscanthus floridulus]|uniref:uncharacterized protein n=1 Tax=Miscanthus floridulus TaxID=154761 RepID=UPI00345ADD0C
MKEQAIHELELREDVNVSRVGTEDDEVTCVGSSEPHKLGPIDKWTRAIDPKATKSESLKQQKLNKELWKQRTHEVHKYIARWAYTHAIPFNACDNDEFKQMCEAIGYFVSSKEMSDVSHTSEVIFELVDKAIEDIGPDDVVQVVTDNASNNMGAKKLLLEKRPNIFWTSCATHTINLMLQGISNMPRFKKDVKLCLSVFEPLVKVLCLVDGDVKPSMGFIYGELLKAKREIKEAYGNVQSRYNKVIAIIDKKMKGRLDSPLHLTAYLLNPYYSYGNPSIFDDATITVGFMSYVETFYHHDEDKQDQAVNTELDKFHNRE